MAVDHLVAGGQDTVPTKGLVGLLDRSVGVRGGTTTGLRPRRQSRKPATPKNSTAPPPATSRPITRPSLLTG